MGRVQFIQLFNSQRDWSERSFLVVFVFGFGAMWMTAVAGSLYQLRIANSLLWFRPWSSKSRPETTVRNPRWARSPCP